MWRCGSIDPESNTALRTMNDQGNQKEIMEAFESAAEEHLQEMNRDLLEMEKIPSVSEKEDLIVSFLRRCHNVKGAAALVQSEGVIELVHALEGLMVMIKSNKLEGSRNVFDLLFEIVDAIYLTVHCGVGFGGVNDQMTRNLRARITSVLSDRDRRKARGGP
jgi:chemotaxis protein histidine kinase CheA